MNGDIYVGCSPLGPIVVSEDATFKIAEVPPRTDPASEKLSSTKLLLTHYSQLLSSSHSLNQLVLL
jgi:hypothetical protein